MFELDNVLAGIDDKREIPPRPVYRRKLLDSMARAFPGAEIDAPKDREYFYDLIDPDDGHVAHAAIFGKADAIVTDDTRAGFRESKDLAQAQIQIVHPAQFAANTVTAHPHAGARAIRTMSARMDSPPMTPSELLELLKSRYSMGAVEATLAPLLSEAKPEH